MMEPNSPHSRAVKVDKHPLIGVEVEGVGMLYAPEEVLELWTDEGTSCIGGIHM